METASVFDGEFRAIVGPWLIWNEAGLRNARVERQELVGWAQAAVGVNGDGIIVFLCDPMQGMATFEIKGDPLVPGTVVGPDPEARMGNLIGGFTGRKFSRGTIRIDEAPADPRAIGGVWEGTINVSFDSSLPAGTTVAQTDFAGRFRAPLVERSRVMGWICAISG